MARRLFIPRRIRLRIYGVVAVLVLPIASYVLVRWSTGNFGAVDGGTVFRSGQMWPRQMARTLDAHDIRTVLNLRGSNPDQSWYRDERRTVLGARAIYLDVALASDLFLSRDEARVLVEILDGCERPLLIHCEWGAERTGLVSAMSELLRPGGSIASGRSQFSPRFLYLPIRDGLVMRAHIDRYESWLSGQRLAHSPDQFRHWLLGVYKPGSPSREEWPYNPYPLVIVSKPRAAAVAHRPPSPRR